MKARQFLVIGAGRFGVALAKTLYSHGHEVVVIDKNEPSVEAIMDDVTHAYVADSTDQEALTQVGIGNFDVVIVAIGNDFEANILTTVAAKDAGAKHVVSKAVSDLGARVLARIGADEVVRPEHDMGLRVAQQLTTPNLVDAFNLGENHTVIEVEAEQKICGRLNQLRLPNRFGVQVIAVHHRGELVVTPGAEYSVERGDKLVLIGSNDDVARFRNHLAD